MGAAFFPYISLIMSKAKTKNIQLHIFDYNQVVHYMLTILFLEIEMNTVVGGCFADSLPPNEFDFIEKLKAIKQKLGTFPFPMKSLLGWSVEQLHDLAFGWLY